MTLPILLLGFALGQDAGPAMDAAVEGGIAAPARRETPRPRPGVRRSAARARAAPGQPPTCPNHRQPEPLRASPAAPGFSQAPFPGAGTMGRMMDQMMASMAQNPASGFRDFLAAQERDALRDVRLTPAEERRIGRQFRENYLREASRRGYRVVDDPARVKYLETLVARLASGMRNRARYPEIDVTLIDAPIADGQSFPGGSLIFTTALLDEPDEATVAGVVAHELAHLDRGHLYEYAGRAKLLSQAFTPDGPGMDFDRFLTRAVAAGGVMANPFRPEHELEADCQAATWLYQAGYDPRAMARFFERLHREQQDQPDAPFFQITRSHPFSLDRRDEVLDRLRQLRRWRDRGDLGLFPENLRRREVHGAEPPDGAAANPPRRSRASGRRAT
jgi:predicted Zn-dependent protease